MISSVDLIGPFAPVYSRGSIVRGTAPVTSTMRNDYTRTQCFNWPLTVMNSRPIPLCASWQGMEVRIVPSMTTLGSRELWQQWRIAIRRVGTETDKPSAILLRVQRSDHCDCRSYSGNLVTRTSSLPFPEHPPVAMPRQLSRLGSGIC